MFLTRDEQFIDFLRKCGEDMSVIMFEEELIARYK